MMCCVLYPLECIDWFVVTPRRVVLNDVLYPLDCINWCVVALRRVVLNDVLYPLECIDCVLLHSGELC